MQALLLLFAVLCLAGCKSTQAPKSSAYLQAVRDSTKAATIDSIFTAPKYSHGRSSLDLGPLLQPGGSLTVYLNIITPEERQRLEAENAKLKKKAATFEKIAALILLGFTGYLVKTSTD